MAPTIIPTLSPELREQCIRRSKIWKLKVDRGFELLEPIPHPGLAKPHHWRNTWPGTTKTQGRNHPEVGFWLIERYCTPSQPAGDPMGGDGGLWIKVESSQGYCAPFSKLHFNELELRRLALAKGNLVKLRDLPVRLYRESAVRWEPKERLWGIITSPVFGKNHSNGKGEHQTQIRESKNANAMQEFIADHPENLALLPRPLYWARMLEIYTQMRTYLHRDGRAVVILKNHRKEGVEVDDVGDHMILMRMAGWKIVGAHPRELAATMFNQWRKNSDGRPFVNLEWSVVLKR